MWYIGNKLKCGKAFHYKKNFEKHLKVCSVTSSHKCKHCTGTFDTDEKVEGTCKYLPYITTGIYKLLYYIYPLKYFFSIILKILNVGMK